ncbi:MAG: hypothetical protein ACE5F1_03270 [Planctomycetota bacterium]
MTSRDRQPPDDPRTSPDREAELAGEFSDLLDDFRGIPSPEPSDRLSAVLRAKLMLRRRYRGSLAPRGLVERLDIFRVRLCSVLASSSKARIAFVLLLCAVGLFFAVPAFDRITRPASPPGRSVEAPIPALPYDPAPSPGALPSRVDLRAWLSSENDLKKLRRLLHQNGEEELRRRLRRVGGADTRTRARIEALASKVAADLRQGLEDPPSYESVEALSLGLRALLLAGSTIHRGPHAELVRRTLDRLEGFLPDLEGPALATALAGYLEGVLVAGGRRLDVLARQVARFTREQSQLLAEDTGSALAMNRWSCPLGALGDAGVLLRLAPALGVSAEAALDLRRAFLDHLLARKQAGGASGAAARASLLVAYPDLVDREALIEELRVYRLNPDWLSDDLRALQFLVWGTLPPGRGWARINQECRHFVANFVPASPVDRASLLLIQLRYTAPNF